MSSYMGISDAFPSYNGLKQGNALSPLLFNFCLEYTKEGIRESGTARTK